MNPNSGGQGAPDETSTAHKPRADVKSLTRWLAETGVNVSDSHAEEALANLAVLQDHAATLREFALDPRTPGALRFVA